MSLRKNNIGGIKSILMKNGTQDALIVDFPEVPRHETIEKIKSAKKVTFCANSTMRTYCDHLHDGDGRSCNSWYNKDDYKSFRKNAEDEIWFARQANSSSFCDREDFCLLGIEMYLSQDLLLDVIERRRVHKLAILAEQGRQFESGCDSLTALQAVSTEYSSWSRGRALMIAEEFQDLQQNVKHCTLFTRAA
ncbi:hypothetical protein ACHAXS_001623 [Conticribra weissflogii]